MFTIHATCVAIAGVAVLLRGPSGAGKSDLALRLIDAGGLLVADDRTQLQRQGMALIASSPESICGLLEVRGIGPVEVTAAKASPVHLVIDLVPPAMMPRVPEPRQETFLDIALPCLSLNPFEASAPVKVKLALARAMANTLFAPAEARMPGAPLQMRRA